MNEITMEMARCDDVLERMVPSDVRQLIGRAERAEARVKEIESAWQDAELRADKNLKRIEELEATLKTLAAQAMYAAGYTKKGDWKNETL